MIYKCDKCNATECKLWRVSSTSCIELRCWTCLESEGHKINLSESDQIYDRDISSDCWVPACPDLDGSYWGYTSVPRWWVVWWKTLPDKKTDCRLCCGSGKLLESFSCCQCNGTGKQDGADSPPAS